MPVIPPFSHTHLQAMCDVLGDTANGLTGSEIGRLLSRCGIEDPLPGLTKRYRLFEALKRHQDRDRCGNHIAEFIQVAMDPVRYAANTENFEERREALNQVLVFAGLSLGEDGKLRHVQRAQTLSEAEERAGRLRAELRRRGVHPDVLRFCRAEIVDKNYFHAVLEATKSVAEKIRQKAGLTADGSQLVDQAFALGQNGIPGLAFNSLQTETERSEHVGLIHLFKGVVGAFRNPTSHAPKILWEIGERDALDLLTLVSLLHRRLDQAIETRWHAY